MSPLAKFTEHHIRFNHVISAVHPLSNDCRNEQLDTDLNTALSRPEMRSHRQFYPERAGYRGIFSMTLAVRQQIGRFRCAVRPVATTIYYFSCGMRRNIRVSHELMRCSAATAVSKITLPPSDMIHPMIAQLSSSLVSTHLPDRSSSSRQLNDDNSTRRSGGPPTDNHLVSL